MKKDSLNAGNGPMSSTSAQCALKAQKWWQWLRRGHSDGQRSVWPPEFFVCLKARPRLTWLLSAARWSRGATPSTRPQVERGSVTRRDVASQMRLKLNGSTLLKHVSAGHSPRGPGKGRAAAIPTPSGPCGRPPGPPELFACLKAWPRPQGNTPEIAPEF